MPAGLDGNPEPVVSVQRSAVIDEVARSIIRARVPAQPMSVGIDGIDGSGKSTFADEVAAALVADGMAVVRASIDSFHRPRTQRWRRGRDSPVGFYLDSHDLDALRTRLLEPFRLGAGGGYVVEVFDEPSDRPIASTRRVVGADDILVVDGIFLHRPELASYWDLSVFLDGADRVALERLGRVFDSLPTDATDAAVAALEWAARFDRYAAGMRYYIDLAEPEAACSILVDNNDLTNPTIVRTTT